MAKSDIEWSSLLGQTVELQRSWQTVRRGKVGAVADDSSMMWLEPDGPHGRQLIMQGDAYDIKVAGCHD